MSDSPPVADALSPDLGAAPANTRRPRPDGVVLIAIWYAVLAGGAAFAACIVTIPIGFISLADDMPAGGRLLASVLVGLGLTMTVLSSVALAATAWGLWNLRPWARLAALLIAVIHIPFFPMGTAIGVGTLWYLTSQEEARAAFGVG